ncbi:MAG: DUF554 domain-containing protein [Synergistaceae bacterium]
MDFVGSFILSGSLINALLVILGSLVGFFLRKKLPRDVMLLPMTCMGLVVFALGVSMALKSVNPLIMVVSVVVGSVVGSLLKLEEKFSSFCEWVEFKLGDRAEGFALGFVASTVLFCTGSMAILGAFEQGFGGYPSLLITKSFMDGMTSVAMGASLGVGVLFSSIPIFVYQGFLTLFAQFLRPFVSDAGLVEMSATGGIILMAIGLNLLGWKKIFVMNMVPGLLFAVVLGNIFLN